MRSLKQFLRVKIKDSKSEKTVFVNNKILIKSVHPFHSRTKIKQSLFHVGLDLFICNQGKGFSQRE